MHAAALRAEMDIPAGEEMTVASSFSLVLQVLAWPLEATFDGGARWVGGLRVADAGATLWGLGPGGGPPVQLATAVVAIPAGATA